MLYSSGGVWKFLSIYNLWVVSGLHSSDFSICCLGVTAILEFETIETRWPANDKIALT